MVLEEVASGEWLVARKQERFLASLGMTVFYIEARRDELASIEGREKINAEGTESGGGRGELEAKTIPGDQCQERTHP
jgi:hypothetical protein